MNRRTFLAALACTPALAALIAACGDDSKKSSGNSIPSNPEEVILSIRYEGGFVPADFAFVNLPTLLIAGDGRAFVQGAMTEQYPGPLLTPINERQINAAGLEKIIKLADDAGLLAPPPDYTLPADVMIADAPDTVVTINVNGTTFEHRANALGMELPDGGSVSPERDNLGKFVNLLSDFAQVAGSENVGEERPFVPASYRFRATGVDPTQWADPAPTIVEWPGDTGVVLAEAGQCATAEAGKVDELFLGATQLTFFQEGDVVYQLAVAGVLPGDAVC